MRRCLLAVAVAAAVLAPAAAAASGTGTTTPTAPVFDGKGHLVRTPFVPRRSGPQLKKKQALRDFERFPKVAAWLSRYPRHGLVDEETYSAKTGQWTVKIWWGAAGEIAQGTVEDSTGGVVEAWTGPQVAWGMARGSPGAFGGTAINDPWIWGAFCAVFLLGLADFRRPLSLRNLDLLFLLSPTASLWFFNRGDVFTAVPLFYPLLVWVVLRATWIGARGRGTPGGPRWPAWVLLAATVFLAGFRIGLNVERSNVIDVGYSGVIGAERIVDGQAPWGNFPVEQLPNGKYLRPCGPADASGEIRDRIQTNGRCESANPQGDTYGPAAYEAYIPGYLALGWSGKWDDLPAAHFTTIAFDLLTLLGLWLVGLRFGGRRLAAVLGFAWVAYPFTQYASNSNTNDVLMPCFLVWGLWLATAPASRGVFAALSGWTKFASLIVAPLWLTYPERRPSVRFAAGFAAATLAAFSIVLLAPHPLQELHVFWQRTIGWQIGRPSPFSLWDWRQYHARGLPDLRLVQRVLQALLVAGALVVAFFPRRKSPLQLAALTAALLAGFQLVVTYWFYTYIPWFYPFAAVALLAPAVPLVYPGRASERNAQELDRLRPAAVGAGDDHAFQADAALRGLEPDR
ncbi:MAG TPA: hypothetical protein VE088_07745 [Gaiellaceae bacterium]|nr:hypothetical protein [Gaiellaceae bacterium]